MSEQKTTLTPEQRNHFASRTKHDAKLLEGGASYDENGRLTVTPEQIENLGRDFTAEQLDNFFERTQEGRQIIDHRNHLNAFDNALGGRLGYAVRAPLANKANGIDFESLEPENYRAWAEREEFDADFDNFHDEAVVTATLNKVRRSGYDLSQLADKLIRYPEYRIGKEVTVMRNGRNGTPPYPESGWRVTKIRPDGRLEVSSENQDVRKFVDIETLIDWSKTDR